MPPIPHRKEFQLQVTVEADTCTATVEVVVFTCEKTLVTHLVETTDMYNSKGFFNRKTAMAKDAALKKFQAYDLKSAKSFVNAMIGSYYYET